MNIVPKAYILFTIKTGSIPSTINALQNIPQISEAHSLYGVYDIICKIETETMEELKDVMSNKIRRIEEVKATIIMMMS